MIDATVMRITVQIGYCDNNVNILIKNTPLQIME